MRRGHVRRGHVRRGHVRRGHVKGGHFSIRLSSQTFKFLETFTKLRSSKGPKLRKVSAPCKLYCSYLALL